MVPRRPGYREDPKASTSARILGASSATNSIRSSLAVPLGSRLEKADMDAPFYLLPVAVSRLYELGDAATLIEEIRALEGKAR